MALSSKLPIDEILIFLLSLLISGVIHYFIIENQQRHKIKSDISQSEHNKENYKQIDKINNERLISSNTFYAFEVQQENQAQNNQKREDGVEQNIVSMMDMASRMRKSLQKNTIIVRNIERLYNSIPSKNYLLLFLVTKDKKNIEVITFNETGEKSVSSVEEFVENESGTVIQLHDGFDIQKKWSKHLPQEYKIVGSAAVLLEGPLVNLYKLLSDNGIKVETMEDYNIEIRIQEDKSYKISSIKSKKSGEQK